jgi:GMP synthase-like glutamine amidotransferase
MLRIGLLVCDTPMEPLKTKHGDYFHMYKKWLGLSLSQFELIPFDVTKMEFPTEDFDCFVITGSSKLLLMRILCL